MRVWISIIPGHGHFFPMVPLARALERTGHEVTFCTSDSYGATVRDHGFTAFGVGLDYTQGGAKGDASEPQKVDSTVAQKMFVESPPMVLDDLLARFEDDRPDVMMFDPWERGGVLAAEAAGVPFGAVVNVIRTGLLLGRLPFEEAERTELIEKQLLAPDRALRQRAGLGEHNRMIGENSFDRTLVLDMVPTSLAPWPRQWASHVWHPLRPEAHESEGDDTWLDSLEGPIVSISLGTLFGSPELYERSTRAALDAGATVVAVTGFDMAIEHESLVRVPWASMDRLLEKTTAFVHHGGWGSMISGLANGVPAVVIPLGSDQFNNAARLASTGAGITVGHERIEDDLTDAIRKVLDDPLYRLNAGRIRSEIAEMPGPDEVVPLIERLATEGLVPPTH